MSTGTAGFLFVLILAAALAAAYRPLGDYLYLVVNGTKQSRFERGVYRLVGVDPKAEQTWGVYARSVLAFSAVSILFLYAFQRLQDSSGCRLGFDAVPSALAWNTAVRFVTNTNWQSYSGESTMGHLVQMAGPGGAELPVRRRRHRGRGRAGPRVRPVRTDQLGNFWVDLTRITLRVLLPLACRSRRSL